MSWPRTVRKSDLRIDYYRGSGKGGQNKNKRDTACRITHLPTGIACTAEEHRTQGKNKTAAFERLVKKLVPIMVKSAKKTDNIEQVTERVRTYHEPRNVAKDHRTGKTAPYDEVLKGNIDLLHDNRSSS